MQATQKVPNGGEGEVVVTDGEVLVYGSQVSADNREATKYSHAFATNAATHTLQLKIAESEEAGSPALSSEERVKIWFDLYRDAMASTGWIVTRYEMQAETASGSALRMDNLVVKAAAGAAGFISGGFAAMAPQMAMVALQELSKSEEALTLISRRVQQKRSTMLSLGLCTEYENGEVVLAVAAVDTDAVPQNAGNVLLVSWDHNSAKSHVGKVSFNFLRSLYDSNKNVIEGAVKASAQSLVLKFALMQPQQ